MTMIMTIVTRIAGERSVPCRRLAHWPPLQPHLTSTSGSAPPGCNILILCCDVVLMLCLKHWQSSFVDQLAFGRMKSSFSWRLSFELSFQGHYDHDSESESLMIIFFSFKVFAMMMMMMMRMTSALSNHQVGRPEHFWNQSKYLLFIICSLADNPKSFSSPVHPPAMLIRLSIIFILLHFYGASSSAPHHKCLHWLWHSGNQSQFHISHLSQVNIVQSHFV